MSDWAVEWYYNASRDSACPDWKISTCVERKIGALALDAKNISYVIDLWE